MKKWIATLCLLSVSAIAQTPKEVVKQLDQLHDVNYKTSAPCATCELTQASSGPYTPQEALADMKSGNLKFMGRDLFPGSDQNRTCVFKNEKAYVLYNNCMANRKEAPALDIEVISFNGGIIRYYVENYKETEKISSMPRIKYDGSWTLNLIASPPPGNLTLTQLKGFKEKFNPSKGSACWIGKTGGAQDMNTKASCYGPISSQQSEWAPQAEKFWESPGADWVPTQQALRKLVETAPF